MAVPTFFSGESARRMERIGRERRQLARVQTARTLTAGAMGATEGATAAQAFLAAHPAHSYERDRARFFQALEAATPAMQAAVAREQYIRQKNLQIMRSSLEATIAIMQEEGANARNTANLNQERYLKDREVQLQEYYNTMGLLQNGSTAYQADRTRFFEDAGYPGLAARSSRSSRGGESYNSAEINIMMDAEGVDLGDDRLKLGEIREAIRNGSLSVRDAAGGEGFDANSHALTAAVARARFPDDPDAARAWAISNGYDGQNFQTDYNDAATTEVIVRDHENLPYTLQTQRAQNVLPLLLAGRGALTGTATSTPNTPADLARDQITRRSYNAMSEEEFGTKMTQLEDAGNEALAAALRRQRNEDYSRTVGFVSESLGDVNETEDMISLNDALYAVNDASAALGIPKAEAWRRTVAELGDSLPPELRGMTYEQAQAATNTFAGDEMRQLGQDLQTIRASGSRAMPQGTLAAMDQLMGLMESFSGDENYIRSEQQRTTDPNAPVTRETAPVEEPEGVDVDGAPEQAQRQLLQGDADAQAILQEQQQANEERLKRGKVLMYGMEVDADRVPDDIGGQVMLMWELASEYPQHPPLQQAIQDQMNSPEFSEWMESRGYTGTPTKQLFREFQREYRVSRRMNRARQRRQIQMNRMTQNRLGQAPGLDTRAPSEIQEEGVFTQQRGREYRQQVGQETRDYRRELQGREDAQRPNLLGGMRQAQSRQRERIPSRATLPSESPDVSK